MRPPFQLRTLGSVQLRGPNGAVSIADPRHLAVLVRLAASDDRSVAVDALLLTVWPHLTPQQGAAALDEAAVTTARLAGGRLIDRTDDRWALTTAVASDFDAATPAEAAGFAAGLTLPDTPEWDDWVATARAGIAGRSAPARTSRVPRIVALGGAIAGILLAVAITRPRPVEGFRPGDQVFLADVEDLTPDSLGRAIRVAAAVALAEASRIELMSRDRMVAALKEPAGPDRAMGADRALTAAATAGVPWVVALRVKPDGDALRVVTRLLRTATGQAAIEVHRSGQQPLGVISAAAETIDAVLRRLGEPSGTRRASRTLGLVTTGNVDALRAYAEGSAAWAVGGYELARDYWLRAVALDTGFAMAMGSLGGFYYYSHVRAEGERYYRAALARADRLTEWERLQLEARHAGWRGDRDSALALGRLIAARFPRASTFFSLGTELLRGRRCAEALEPLEQARRLDPRDVATHVNIATCQSTLGRYDEARRAYREADRLDSTTLYRGNVNLEYAGVVLRAGHPEEAESALVRMTRRPGGVDRALGFRGLGFLAFWRGEVGRAREEFRRAADLSRQQGARNSLLRNLALAAGMERAAGLQGDLRETLHQIDSLAAFELAPGFLALAAEPHITGGNGVRVRQLLEAARARVDPRNRDDSLLIFYLTGAAHLASGAPGPALASFDRAAGYVYPTSLGLRRAQAHEQLGQLDSARASLGQVLARREFGQESQLAWTEALRDLGRIEERLGLVEQAVESYRRFLDHWREGDPGLADVAMVRARVAALLRDRNR